MLVVIVMVLDSDDANTAQRCLEKSYVEDQGLLSLRTGFWDDLRRMRNILINCW